MSADVTILCHRLHTGGGKWCWVDGAPNQQCLDDARNFGWELELAVSHAELIRWKRLLAEADSKLFEWEGKCLTGYVATYGGPEDEGLKTALDEAAVIARMTEAV